MKLNPWVFFGTVLLGAGIVVWSQWPWSRSASPPPATPPVDGSSAGKSSSAKPVNSPKDLDVLRQGLEAWSKRMIAKGMRIVPSPAEQLRVAVATEDKPTILRAFHDVVYGHYQREEVLPCLRDYLASENVYVRYKAAESLYIMGDQSGYDALLGLVKLDEPFFGIGQDVRFDAAETLAKFREKRAGQAICDLYLRTKNRSLIQELTLLQAPQVRAFITGVYSESSSIRYYVLNNKLEFIPQLSSMFHQSSDPEIKVAAAWALASMTKDPAAEDYLLRQAQAILTNPGMLDGTKEGGAKYTAGANALQYLGTMQDPRAKEVLERAIDSENTIVAENAIANLLYNQGGSDKAMQAIIEQLSHPAQQKLELEFVLNIAAQNLGNPKVRMAGEKFVQRQGDSLWRHLVVERQEWPIYNWIDNYVIQLNENP